MFGDLGLSLSAEAPRAGLLGLRLKAAGSDGPLVGVVSVRVADAADSAATIDCLAYDAAALDEQAGLQTDEVLDFMVETCLEHARDRGCTVAKVGGWVDHQIDARGPLAPFRGGPRDSGQQLLEACRRAGFAPAAAEDELEVMFGCPLDETLPPVPQLPDGYSLHFLRPGMDEPRWEDTMHKIFTESDCEDPYFTAANLYTRRSDYHMEEVVLVEREGDEYPAAIGAGVSHAFSLRLDAEGRLDFDLDADGRHRTTYLDWIGVTGEHRGKQIGQVVSLTCMHALRSRGFGYCTLWTTPAREAAVRLYTRLGFLPIAKMVSLQRSLL